MGYHDDRTLRPPKGYPEPDTHPNGLRRYPTPARRALDASPSTYQAPDDIVEQLRRNRKNLDKEYYQPHGDANAPRRCGDPKCCPPGDLYEW